MKYFVLVNGTVVVLWPGGSKFIIIYPRVINCVIKIFQVIESKQGNPVLLFCGLTVTDMGQDYQGKKKKYLFHIHQIICKHRKQKMTAVIL